jgi:hypothetical protein
VIKVNERAAIEIAKLASDIEKLARENGQKDIIELARGK